jgi:hypothetical protein
VHAVTEITKPGLQCGSIVLGDQAAVGVNGGSSSDGSPLSRGVDEGDVDMGVGGEVVSLARLGVSVEEQVNASGLLLRGQCGHA